MSLLQRVRALSALFHVADASMRDLPIYNPALSVETVGFQLYGDGSVLGILVTPWSMNLMLLPLTAEDWEGQLHHGAEVDQSLPCGTVRFVVGRGEGFGLYQMCSLFSPMEDFPSQEVALAVAEATLAEVLRVPEPIAPPPPVASGPMSRRSLLRGWRSAEDGTPPTR